MGKFDDAEKAFEMAYSCDTNNPVIKEWLQKFKEKTNPKRSLKSAYNKLM